MKTPLSADEIERIARKRAGAKLGWYIHASLYLLVNAVIFSLSTQGLWHRPWSAAPALGWGLGVVLHGIAVFALGTGSSLREHLVQKERERLQKQQLDR